MSDKYQKFVSHGVGRKISSTLGLPRPAILRRYKADAPLLPGPALVVTLGESAIGKELAEILTRAGVELVEAESLAAGSSAGGAGASADADAEARVRPGAIVIDATGAGRIADLTSLPAATSVALKRLRSSGRVIVLGTSSTPGSDIAAADGGANEGAADSTGAGSSGADGIELTAVRQALDGLTRSIGKELRAGATANLVYLTPGFLSAGSAAATGELEATLRFLCSGRSAYVDGQVLRLAAAVNSASAPTTGTDTAGTPWSTDWSAPLGGKVALVTGAARGIGAAIAKTLARDGATVICADLPAAGEALSRVANDIGGTTLQLDISATEAPERIADYLRERFGGVDIVVHNAGITRDRLLANMKPEVWDSVLNVNLAAQLRINAALLEAELLRPGGRIVSLSSTSGLAGNRGQTNYAASKAGIVGMVRATAPVLASTGATINAIAPGFIDTEMTARMPFATREVARRLNSLQQAGLPIDVAEAVAFLASPGAGAITGQVLRVCGQNLVGA